MISFICRHLMDTGIDERREGKYLDLKETIADNLVRPQILIPGYHGIRVKDISTPMTYRIHPLDGGWYDAACTPERSLLKRTSSATPVESYLTGAFPVPACSGRFKRIIYC
jgi:hypothetical protein